MSDKPIATERSGLTRKERERLDRINARCAILRVRIEEGPKRDYMEERMELSALDWAVNKIESYARSETGKNAAPPPSAEPANIADATTHGWIDRTADLIEAHGCKITAGDLRDTKRVIPNVQIYQRTVSATGKKPWGVTGVPWNGCKHEWPGPGPMPAKWDCACGTRVYRSREDAVDD